MQVQLQKAIDKSAELEATIERMQKGRSVAEQDRVKTERMQEEAARVPLLEMELDLVKRALA